MSAKRFPLDLPPGMVASGTTLQSEGRWFDGQLIRFLGKDKRPVGGWRRMMLVDSDDDKVETVDNVGQNGVGQGVVRGMLSWRRAGGGPVIALGTVRFDGSQGLFVLRAGVFYDITPAGENAPAGGTIHTTESEPPTFFVLDTFSPATPGGESLASHVGEIGAAWVEDASQTTSHGRVTPAGALTTTASGQVVARPTASSPLENFYVLFRNVKGTHAAGQFHFNFGIRVAADFSDPGYWGSYKSVGAAAVFTLHKDDGSDITAAGAPLGTYFTLEIRREGTAVKLLVDDVLVLSTTRGTLPQPANVSAYVLLSNTGGDSLEIGSIEGDILP